MWVKCGAGVGNKSSNNKSALSQMQRNPLQIGSARIGQDASATVLDTGRLLPPGLSCFETTRPALRQQICSAGTTGLPHRMLQLFRFVDFRMPKSCCAERG